MNFAKKLNLSRFLYSNLQRCNLRQSQKFTFVNKIAVAESDTSSKFKFNFRQNNEAIPIGISLLGLSFFRKDDEETPEDKLVTTLKRSILFIQREQYEKAEQMLHLALRMAQDMQSKEGITYVYDVMANLAMEREQYKKAEKLFADVMKRLFADGYTEDSTKMLHISSKMAHMAQLQGFMDKAMQGYTWTLNKLEEKLKNVPDDADVRELWGLTRNWFGQLLMEQEKFQEAKKCFLDAYAIYTEIHGKLNAEAITMLNNLSVVCTNLNDNSGAKSYLEQALELAEQIPDLAEMGTLKVNMGLLYIKEGLLQQAKDFCSAAWKWGRKSEDQQTVKQAEYCLEKLKEFPKF